MLEEQLFERMGQREARTAAPSALQTPRRGQARMGTRRPDGEGEASDAEAKEHG
jgi:hypothetical protein